MKWKQTVKNTEGWVFKTSEYFFVSVGLFVIHNHVVDTLSYMYVCVMLNFGSVLKKFEQNFEYLQHLVKVLFQLCTFYSDTF